MKKLLMVFCWFFVQTVGLASAQVDPVPIEKVFRYAHNPSIAAIQPMVPIHPHAAWQPMVAVHQRAYGYPSYGADFDFSLPNTTSSKIKQEVSSYRFTDILLGKHYRLFDHSGNWRFREIILSYQEEYHASSDHDKEALLWNLVALVKSKGFRFLKHEESKKVWRIVNDEIAKKIVRKVLNEKKPASPKMQKVKKAENLQPRDYIFTYDYYDVLLGRGGKKNQHPGNLEFRRFVVPYKERYSASTKNEKTALTRELLDYIKSKQVRFLKYEQNLEVWYEVDDEVARQKISQTIRDGVIYFDDEDEE